MKRWMTLFAALLSFSLIAAACGDDDDAAEETPATDEAAADGEAAGDGGEAEAPGTIPEVAASAGSFTTLLAAVEAAGLSETLSGEGPFTVFAPTDEAFAAAIEALGTTPEELLANPDLADILTYHVVPGQVMAADIVAGDVATVNGANVTLAVDGGTVTVNDATVVTADVAASNGVIHVIDAVLLPPAE
jgi:transforming growth factor-beta-induced protein